MVDCPLDNPLFAVYLPEANGEAELLTCQLPSGQADELRTAGAAGAVGAVKAMENVGTGSADATIF